MTSLQRIVQRVRNSISYRMGLGSPVPTRHDSSLAAADSLFNIWRYYTIELQPGRFARGIYPDDLPLLPRILLRNCGLTQMDCLDIGTMEGLMPVLMKRGGARRVLALDAEDHCAVKLAAVKQAYEVDFEYRSVGLLYNLAQQLAGQSFDLINLSGLLYHVFSPLLVLAAVRPLLKRDGLLLVSTNVLLEDSFDAAFNAAGRMQTEANTFWYLSVPLFDYLLRYLKLAPVDCLYVRHADVKRPHARLTFDQPSGYLAVVCRAAADVLPQAGDAWMRNSAQTSWEFQGVVDWTQAKRQPRSKIRYRSPAHEYMRPEAKSIDLWATVSGSSPVQAVASHDAHVLRLTDQT